MVLVTHPNVELPVRSSTVRVEPPRGHFGLRFGEVWAHRELLYCCQHQVGTKGANSSWCRGPSQGEVVKIVIYSHAVPPRFEERSPPRVHRPRALLETLFPLVKRKL